MDNVRATSFYDSTTFSFSTASFLSGVVDLSGYSFFAINMTTAWDAANLTMQACPTGDGTFHDVYDDSGNEVVITVASSRCIPVNANMFNMAPLRFVKFRSGLTSTSVYQSTGRTIGLIKK